MTSAALCPYCGLPVKVHGEENNWCQTSEAAHLAMVNLEYQLKLSLHANTTLRNENARLRAALDGSTTNGRGLRND